MGTRCRNCHYALEGLTGPPHRCPECGGEFDPNESKTFIENHSQERGIWRILLGLLLTAIVLSILCAYGIVSSITVWGGIDPKFWPTVLLSIPLLPIMFAIAWVAWAAFHWILDFAPSVTTKRNQK